ncbi:MAG: hypothetical protein ACWGNK_05700 [Desulfobacterales bacterium]
MNRYRLPTIGLCLGVAGLCVLLHSLKARAVPSFARQTGMSCTTCHTVFPELTPFGRQFKLGGFTFSTVSPSEPWHPPIAAMFQASLTVLQNNSGVLTNGVAPFDNATDSATDKVNFPQQASLFYGGRIVDHFGALAQLTYDGTANDIALDLTDIRYARQFSPGGTNLNVGFTLNNSPTVEDIWNSTPDWGFPYAASAVAPTPAAAPLIDGALTGQVGGIGIYANWHNLLYGAFTVYRTTADGITRPLGAGNDVDTETDGAVPYWRFALHHSWGGNSAELGTYGLYAKVKPNAESGPSDNKFTDVAFDAQYQYIVPPHLFSVQATYIHEKQDWDGSYALGLTSNPDSNLDQFKVNFNYYYRSRYGPIGGSVAYFRLDGDADPTLYSPDPVDGSRTGSPDSGGFIFEADYVFREKYKFSLQYTLYTKFNGSSSNYDGFGRDASDNNTFYALAWLMF